MKPTSDSDNTGASEREGGQDPWLARVAALPQPALDPLRHARVLQAARSGLLAAGVAESARRGASTGAAARWPHMLYRRLEPVIVAAIVVATFAWTVTALGAIDRRSAGTAGGVLAGPALQLRAR